jgi:hypothetical protein
MRSNRPTPVAVALALALALAVVFLAPQVLLAQYAINTVAGGGPKHLTPLNASIGDPVSIASDAAGNTYFADYYSSRIFKLDTSNNLTVVAGNGTACPQTAAQCGDGGPATGAALNHPEGVFVDAAGNIFIADTFDFVIRAVNTGTQAVTIAGITIQPGYIATVAGNGMFGYSGDGGSATSAQLYDPFGVFVDNAENIYIADTDNCLIRKVSGGNISTVAGNPFASPSPCGYFGDGGLATSAQLGAPQGVFVDATGNIFIADTDNNLIRVVNTGTAPVTVAGVVVPPGDIQIVAGIYYQSEDGFSCGHGGDGGPANSAQLCLPDGVFVDASENIFIADTDNFAIRAVNAGAAPLTIAGVTIQPDDVATVAGTLGVAGYTGDNGLGASAELNYPSGVAVDASDDIFIADTDNFVIREVTNSSGIIQTTIGNNTLAYSGDGQPPVNAELNYPANLSVDAAGDLFIADTDNSVIREVSATNGITQTVVGNGTECDTSTATCGDGGLAVSAQLYYPYGLFLDASGNIFIADTEDNRIRVVNTGTAPIKVATIVIQPGNIATVAGNGTLCPDPTTACGDGGLATAAELSAPYGVFVDSAENIFIADTQDLKIREVIASSGIIVTVAGNGTVCPQGSNPCGDNAIATSAQLAFPVGVFVDLAENIYIADTSDNRIRILNPGTAAVTIAGVLIPPGDIATVAGTGEEGYSGDGAAAIGALLNTPSGLFVDASGDIFFADTSNDVIREVVAATGFIQTVAGNGIPGFAGDGGQSTGSSGQTAAAQLHSPLGVFGDSAGDLFVADTGNVRIRELVPSIFVSVTPNPVNVAVSSQQQFIAAVTGATNTAVIWQVNGVAGGNLSTTGSISTTGLYLAPTAIPTPATVTINAISQADGTTSGSAQATIVGAGGAVTVTVTTSPVGVTQVYTSTVQTFIATVTGTTNTAVNWQVNGIPGGDSTTVGSIDTSGNYTAPAAVPNPATVTIEAVSQALSSAIGSDTITIVTPPTAAQAAPQTASPGGTAIYSLLLNENTGAPGQPIALSCLQSTLPPSGTCTFQPTTITPGAQAVPFSVTISIPSGAASLQQPSGNRLQLFVAFAPFAGILLAGAGRRNKRRLWLWLAGLCVFLILLNACGGAASSPVSANPELGTYNVKVQGTTAAQPNPVTITVVGLTVQ